MSDANRLAMRAVKETVYGTTPATPTMQELRYVSESLKPVTGTTSSNEVRSDRQVSDVIRTAFSVGGEIAGELSYGAFDIFLPGALQSAAFSSAASSTGIVFSFVAGSGTYVIHRSSGSFISDGFSVNTWCNIASAGNAANAGFGKITAITASDMTISRNGNGFTEAAGAVVTVKGGGQIVTGTTFSSYAIEKEMSDLSNEFVMENGCAIDTFGLNVSAQNIVTCSFGFLGKTETSATATAASVVTPATTEEVMNAIDDVVAVYENGSRYDITGLSQSLQNNLRARMQVGTLGAISIGSGTINLTGSHTAFYNTKAVMDRHLAFTATNLAFIMRKNSKVIVLDYPRIKYTDGQRVGGGINTDLMAQMQWTAYRDPSEGITMRLQQFAL